MRHLLEAFGKLNSLYVDGELTDEEFANARAALLRGESIDHVLAQLEASAQDFARRGR